MNLGPQFVQFMKGYLKRRFSGSKSSERQSSQVERSGRTARAVLFKGYKPRGGVKELHILRGEENLDALKRIGEIFEGTRFDGELWNGTTPSSDGETLGVGVHEAPRGTNVHAVKIDKSGKITYYKIVVPTEVNFFAVGEALREVPATKAEIVVRAYDPCIVCAAH